MDYRKESFRQFLRLPEHKARIKLYSWCCVLFFVFFGCIEVVFSGFPLICAAFFLFFNFLLFLAAFFNFKTYQNGAKLLDFTKTIIVEEVRSVKAEVRNADTFQIKRGSMFDYAVTNYAFDRVDVFFTSQSIVLFGFGLSGIFKGYAQPVEFVFSGQGRLPNFVTLSQKPVIENDCISIRFIDKNYRQELHLRLELNEVLLEWLRKKDFT